MTNNPRRDLCIAIIAQAVRDATSPLSFKRDERLAQEDARNWFIRGGRDFREVCELADYDPARVRKKVLPLIEEAIEQDIDLPPDQPRKPRLSRRKTYEHDGKALSIPQWAAETGLSKSLIYERLRQGWSIDRALSTPTRGVVPQPTENAKDRLPRDAGKCPKLEFFDDRP